MCEICCLWKKCIDIVNTKKGVCTWIISLQPICAEMIMKTTLRKVNTAMLLDKDTR